MTAKTKIMTNAIIPCISFLTMAVMMIAYKMRTFQVFGREPNFSKAFVHLSLLLIGTVEAVCAELITCTEIVPGNFVHFYFGSDECYDVTWWVANILFYLFAILFCCFFVKLWFDRHILMSAKQIDFKKYFLESLVKSYKLKQYWYWEMVMFSRRILIAKISVDQGTQTSFQSFMFILMIVYLVLQMNCRPFAIDQVNRMETICLCCLLSILC